MSQKNVKDLRKQIRNVVQEILPEVLKTELFNTISQEVEQKVREVLSARLEAINEAVLSQLKGMDERSKDLQQFMLNQVQAEMARSAPAAQVSEVVSEAAQLVPISEEARPE